MSDSTKPPVSLEDMLGDLQKQIIMSLLAKIKDGTATGTDLNTARQLLKDNNITVSPTADPNLGHLHESLPFEPKLMREERTA